MDERRRKYENEMYRRRGVAESELLSLEERVSSIRKIKKELSLRTHFKKAQVDMFEQRCQPPSIS